MPSKMNSINKIVLLPMEEWKRLVKDNKRDVKTISILAQKGDGHISPSPLEKEKSPSPSPPPSPLVIVTALLPLPYALG